MNSLFKNTTNLLFVFVYLILMNKNTVSQVIPDTTDWFPMQIGNIWQYINTTTYEYSVNEIVGTMTHFNGKEYFKLRYWNEEYGELGYNLYRKDEYGDVYFAGHEGATGYKMFDFTAADRSIWQIDTPFVPNNVNFMGVGSSGTDNDNILGINLPWKLFMYINVDTTGEVPDTNWGAFVDIPSYKVCKGLGFVEPDLGQLKLIGAKLNGVVYGIITYIEGYNSDKIITEINVEAFPNPFNPVTNIRVTLPEAKKVIVKIYSALGEEIKTIYQGELNSGPHVFPFSGEGLTSGVYFCTVTGTNFLKTIKLLLVK